MAYDGRRPQRNGHDLGQVSDRGCSARAHVEDLGRCKVDSIHRRNQETGDILDVDEVPSLLSIAMHIERRMIVQRRREFGNHPRVWRSWVLTRTIDVKESQPDTWHAMHLHRGARV